MKLTLQTRMQINLQKIVFLLLFLSSISMLAWIGNHYNYQFDLTANKRHSLSSSSVDLLKLLNEPVIVHAYSNDEITRQAVTEIIARYQRIKPDFDLQLLNPDIDLAQAQQDGIVMDKPFAFVIFYKGQQEHIDSLSEQSVSNALLRLNRRDNQQLVFLSGHGELDIDATDKRAYNTLKQQLSETGFKLQQVNLLQQSLPENTKVLIIAAPAHRYLKGELDIIEQFITDGGNLLWLTDPVTSIKSDSAKDDPTGLKSLATSLGLQLHDGVIIDNDPELRQTLNIQHPAIIPVTEYSPHIINNTIRYNSLFPITRGISPLSNTQSINNWQAIALFNSSTKSWSEASGLSEEMTFNSSSGDIAGPITIAVALSRDINNSSTEYSSRQMQQRVVVIGDSDFISDTYIGAGANLNLGLNIFNWLLGDDDFIAVETKASPDTKLELNDTELAIIGIGFFLAIPLLLIAIGFRIWHLRQKN